MNNVSKLLQNLNDVIIGKEDVIELAVLALLVDSHVLLEDVPGTGKTMFAKALAKSIESDFSRIQCTADLLPSDITGILFFNQKKGDFELRIGPIMTNILLVDEINRSMPRTQSSLLQAMEEREVTIDQITTPLPSLFFVIATQNPIESQGTFPLPDAQLDRFLMKLSFGYPNIEEEKRILQNSRKNSLLDNIHSVITVKEILTIREEIKHIHISPVVEDYLLKIVHYSRKHSDIRVGVSTRGALMLAKSAQGRAYLKGRDYCIPEDVQKVAPFVCGHRIQLKMESSMTTTGEQVMHTLLEQIDIPVEVPR